MASKEDLVEKEKNRQDLGFGTKVTNKTARLVQQDGTFNVKRKGQSFKAWLNIYHRLITMGSIKFAFLVFSFYLIVNFIFAGLYVLLGVRNLQGIIGTSKHDEFWEAFFFSSQTITTVGYGRIAPASFATSFLSSIEALLGLMIFALVTGILYGRFSRPQAHVLFSKKAVIAPYFDKNAFMFRIVNEKSNQIINVKINIVFSRIEDVNGSLTRKYYNLPLERDFVTFFPMNWTIVHAITEDSPLWGETADSLRESDAEFLTALEGREDTFSEAIHTRSSYLYDDVVWGAKFKLMLDTSDESNYLLDLNKIDDYDLVELNA
jgi:inward rectifier potassium channel